MSTPWWHRLPPYTASSGGHGLINLHRALVHPSDCVQWWRFMQYYLEEVIRKGGTEE